MTIFGEIIRVSTSIASGMLTYAFLWMWCHRLMYNKREFGVILLTGVFMAYRINLGNPPDSHFVGALLLNAVVIGVIAMIIPRPRHIPMIERRRHCGIHRLLSSAKSRETAL